MEYKYYNKNTKEMETVTKEELDNEIDNFTNIYVSYDDYVVLMNKMEAQTDGD